MNVFELLSFTLEKVVRKVDATHTDRGVCGLLVRLAEYRDGNSSDVCAARP